MLRALHHDLISPHLPIDGSLDDVPLLYLSTVLYVNFAVLWPETVELIESHGRSLSNNTLWGCFGVILHTAAHNSMGKSFSVVYTAYTCVHINVA